MLDAIERDRFNYAAIFPNSLYVTQFAHEPRAVIFLNDYLDLWLKEVRPKPLSESEKASNLHTAWWWAPYKQQASTRQAPEMHHVSRADSG